jgi:hypothetical protein
LSFRVIREILDYPREAIRKNTLKHVYFTLVLLNSTYFDRLIEWFIDLTLNLIKI